MKKIDTFQAFARGVKSLVAILLVMLMAVGSLFAEEYTVVFSTVLSDYAESHTLPVDEQIQINENFYFVLESQNANNPAYYPADGLRMYSHRQSGEGNTFTLYPASNITITGLELTTVGISSYPSVTYAVDGGDENAMSVESGIYSVSGINAATSIMFCNRHSGGSSNLQLRLSQIKITYEVNTPDEPVVIEPTWVTCEQVGIFNTQVDGLVPTCSVVGDSTVYHFVYNSDFTQYPYQTPNQDWGADGNKIYVDVAVARPNADVTGVMVSFGPGTEHVVTFGNVLDPNNGTLGAPRYAALRYFPVATVVGGEPVGNTTQRNWTATFEWYTDTTLVAIQKLNVVVDAAPVEEPVLDVDTVAELPYTYNFDEGIDPFFMIDNGENTNAWYIDQAQGFDNKKLYISSNNGTTNKYNVTAASNVVAYRDVMIPAAGAVLSFDYRVNGQANYDYLQVSLEHGNEATPIAQLSGENEWNTFSYDISGEMAGVVRIKFQWVNNASAGNQFPAAIDNIAVMETPCSQPTTLIADVDSTSALISWVAAEGQTAWTFQYKLANHSEWYTMNVTEATSVSLSDLQGNSNYDMRVQAVCGEYTSAWTTGTFVVACQEEESVTAPADVVIGTGTSTTNYLFPGYYGWQYTAQLYEMSQYGVINSVGFYLNTASSTTGSTMTVWVKAVPSNYALAANNTFNGMLEGAQQIYNGEPDFSTAGWMTFPVENFSLAEGENLLVLVRGVGCSTSGGCTKYNRYTSASNKVWYKRVGGSDPGQDVTGSLSFYRPNITINMDITTVTCADVIACANPSNLTVDNVTANSAELTWTAGDENQNSFIIEYVAEDANVDVVVEVNDTTFTLTDLTQLTNYTVRVKANCGENNWSDVLTEQFRTKGICALVTDLETANVSNSTTLTWTAGSNETAWLVQFKPATAGDDEWTSIDVNLIPMTTFGGLQGNTDYEVRVKALCSVEDPENQSEWAYTEFHSGCAAFDIPFVEEFPTNNMPECWDNAEFHFASSGYAYSYTNDAELVSPAINIPAENPTYLAFEVRGAGAYTVLASYRGTRADRFAEIYSGIAPSQNETIIVPIDDLYKGRAVNFKFVNNSSSYQYIYNVKVNQCPFEVASFNSTGYTGTTVDLAWEADESLASFQVQYGEQGFNVGEGTNVDVTDTTATTISGLNYETTYDFYVRVVCPGDNGVWNGPVTQTTAPACSDPESLSFDFTSAQLHWNKGEWGTPSQYNVRYREEGAEEYTTDVVIPVVMPGYTPFYTISGLQSNTSYEMGVQSVCGENMESNWVTLMVTTPCMPLTEIPYTQDFEGDVFPPECWSQVYVSGTEDWTLSNGAAYFEDNSYNANQTRLLSPSFDLSGISGDLVLKFNHMQPAWGSDQDELRVYYRPSSLSSWVLLAAYTDDIQTMTMEEITLPAAAMTSSCQFAFDATGAWGYGITLDDVTIDYAPTCGTPTISVTDLTLTITPSEVGTPAFYEVVVTDGELAQTATVTTTTVDLASVFTTLASSTTYQVNVRSNCGGEDYSDLSNTVNFTTPCMPVDLPFVEEFESTTFPPLCWTRYKVSGNGNSEWNTTTTHHNGSRGAYIPDQSATTLHNLVTPKINIPAGGAILKFWVKRESNYLTKEEEGIKVMYGANEDGTGATELIHIHRPYSKEPVEAAAGWYEYSVVVPEGQHHIIFQGINEYGGATYMDDINIDVVPSCMYPTAITLGTVTETTAQVSWTAGGTETEWEVSYTVNDLTVTETTNDNPYTITGLSASTHYVIPFSVKAICSATDESEVTSTDLTFNTVCGVAAVPYAENFDAYTSTTTQSTMVMPVCWSRKYTGTSTSYGAGIYNSTSYAVSGTNSLRIYNYGTTSTSTSYGEAYAVMPMLDAALNTLMISFDAKRYNSTTSTYGSLFEVGVVTDAANPETSFTTIQTLSAPVAGERFTVSLANYDGEAGYIAFRATKAFPEGYTNTYFYNYTYIDNVLVEAIPTCFVPTQLNVSDITDNSAVVTWNDSYDQAGYAVEYMAEGDADWTTVTVDTNYALLSNLLPLTGYTVRVKAVCGAGDESDYTDEIGFTTKCVAGTDAEIAGTGTDQYYLPVNSYFNYAYTQQILTADEINAIGTISSISFEYAYSSAMTSKNNVRIYMVNTDKSEFESTSDWFTEGLQLVYEGDLNCAQGWNEFALNTPFAYAGGNLAIIVEDNSGAYNGSAYKFKTTNTTTYSALTWQSDGAAYAGETGTRRLYHSNVRLTICPEATDLAITSINEFNASCDVEGAVTIGVKNLGYEGTVSTFEAYYQVNEETPVHETVTLATPIAFNETAEYTFNQLPAFTASENIINAWVELTGDLVDVNNTITSAPIIVLDPKAVPYQEYFWEPIGWNSIDANNDGITMVVGNQGISYSFNDELAADDWMMSPCVELAAGTYTVTYDYAAESALTESFELFYGNGAHIADMTNLVATHTFNNTGVETAVTTITIDADGIYNFGFHATSLAGNLGFNISYFSVQPVNDVVVTYAENGTVTPEGTVAVNYGENLTLSIVPDPMYHVAGVWVDDVQVVPEDGNGSNFMLYTLENVTEPHTVFVDFKLEFHIIKTVENYNSTYEDFGGVFIPAATDTTLNPDPFTVNMVADPHYFLTGLTISPMVPDMPEDVFADVIDNGDRTYSYTIDTLVVANYYLNATFRRDTVDINYFVLTGKGSADDSQIMDATDATNNTYTTWVDYSVNNDVNHTSTFEAAPNYHIVDVFVNGVSKGRINSYDFIDVTETQNVDIKYGYMITTSASNYNTYGSIALDSVMGFIEPDTQYVAEYETMMVSGAAYEHFHLYQLLVNGENRIDEVIFGADPHDFAFIIDSVDNNYDIEAIFKVDTIAINYYVVAGQGYADESELLDGREAVDTFYNIHNYGDNWYSNIVPATGYTIENVMLDGQNLYTASNYQFNYLETSHDFIINFAPVTYTITTNAYGNGTVSEGAQFIYTPDAPFNYDFTATAAEGYYIASITINNEAVDLTGVEDTYTTTIENVADNYTINVTFQMYTYTMTGEAGFGGNITPSGTQIVNYGADVLYQIVAQEGYYIQTIYVDGEIVEAYSQADGVTAENVSFTAIDADHEVFATFGQYKYTITTNISGEPHGTINEFYTSLTELVDYGVNYTLTFDADENYQVADVVIDGTSMGAITSYEFINVTDDHDVVVSFEAIMYTLTASTNIASCTITPTTTTVQAGTDVTYTVTPAQGYHLVSVTANGIEIIVAANNTFTIEDVQGDVTIYAIFASDNVTVTVDQPEHATIAPGTMMYAYGATPSYTIIPEVGYEVVSVTAGNAVVNVTYNNGIGYFTLDALEQDITLTATTAIKTYTITVTQGANGTITPATQTGVEYGSSRTFTITPNDYYVVADVIVDGSSRGQLSSYTFYNVTGNHTITAVFEANCQTPTNLTAFDIDTTSAVVSWVGNATSYEVRYKAADDAEYTTQTVNNATTLTLTGLTPNTLYSWGVRAVCGTSLYSDWAINAFTTKARPVEPVIGIANAELNSIKVYSYLNNVYVVNEDGIAISSIDIYDIYGKQVYTGKVINSPEVISLNVANGNYVVRLATENGVGVYKVAIVR